ncbi:zinc-binding dehydrogenase [Saccharopolyspora taberi]|uniref:Zinc-binding dehydrogenase n=1 Tax=Saccharopolyspora taberi TaxID=60895 RepID=A0ABN3VE83_9PSEU
MLATTTDPAKLPLLSGRGALPVDTASDDLVAQAMRATGGAGVDLVVDHVGGALLDDLVAAAGLGATIIQVGRLGGRRAALDLDRLAYRRVRLVGTTFRTRRGAEHRAAIAADLRERLLPAIASGRVRAHVHEVFPADRADAARDLLRGGGATGKVVLSYGG